MVLISGSSGAGKSSLLSLMSGQLRADSGQVNLFARDVGRLRASSVALLRRRLGIATQRAELLEDESALVNVALAAELGGAQASEARAKAADALAAMGLVERVDVAAGNLSGGERQRVVLARAIVRQPDLLLLDEPTRFLDSSSVDRLVDAMEALRDGGGAVVAVSGDPRLLAAADRTEWRHLTLADGQLHAGVGTEIHDTTIPNVVPFPVTMRAGGTAE